VGVTDVATLQTVKRAKQLRREKSAVEWRLWGGLRNRQLNGHRFRRQHPIGRYIADFVCLDRRVIVEVDGPQHGEAVQMAHDASRTAWLEGEGYVVLRSWTNEIDENMDAVLNSILAELEKRPSGRGVGNTPTSPRQG
jgi:very-short-patch-repair endonuclease